VDGSAERETMDYPTVMVGKIQFGVLSFVSWNFRKFGLQ
jgi:hypothetical protein